MTERRLTISRLLQPPPQRKQLEGYWAERKVPPVRLCGQWLERAGFACGGRVRVEVEPSRLVVTTWTRKDGSHG